VHEIYKFLAGLILCSLLKTQPFPPGAPRAVPATARTPTELNPRNGLHTFRSSATLRSGSTSAALRSSSCCRPPRRTRADASPASSSIYGRVPTARPSPTRSTSLRSGPARSSPWWPGTWTAVVRTSSLKYRLSGWGCVRDFTGYSQGNDKSTALSQRDCGETSPFPGEELCELPTWSK